MRARRRVSLKSTSKGLRLRRLSCWGAQKRKVRSQYKKGQKKIEFMGPDLDVVEVEWCAFSRVFDGLCGEGLVFPVDEVELGEEV